MFVTFLRYKRNDTVTGRAYARRLICNGKEFWTAGESVELITTSGSTEVFRAESKISPEPVR